MYRLEKGEELKNHRGEILTIEQVAEGLKYQIELVEKAMDKQGYLENCLDELGGFQFNKDNIKVGYIVLIKDWGQVEIVRTGEISIGVRLLTGETRGTFPATYAEIDEIIKADEKKRTPHPFVVGEKFTAKIWDGSQGLGKGKYVNVVYEIIKTSDATIKLQACGSDKPITRKPTKNFRGEWRFSIDNHNIFYKEEQSQ